MPFCVPEWFETHVGGNTTPYSFVAYRSRYNMASELYYAYSIGLIRFVVIAGYCPEMNSSSTQPCLQPGKPQRVWLEAELASVNRAITVRVHHSDICRSTSIHQFFAQPWLVVIIHQPWYNSNTAHSIKYEGLVVKDAIEVMMDERCFATLRTDVHLILRLAGFAVQRKG